MDKSKKTYEGMFLLDAGGSDFDAASEPVRKVLDRYEAEMLALKPWDDRRLAYEVRGRRRGLYALTYFRLDPERVREVEHDCQLDERILRVLILHRERLPEEEIHSPTPATESRKAQEARAAERQAREDKKEQDKAREDKKEQGKAKEDKPEQDKPKEPEGEKPKPGGPEAEKPKPGEPEAEKPKPGEPEAEKPKPGDKDDDKAPADDEAPARRPDRAAEGPEVSEEEIVELLADDQPDAPEPKTES